MHRCYAADSCLGARGRTIWAPALVHAAIDLFKLVAVFTGPAAMTFSLALAAVSALVPFLAFADRMFRKPVEKPAVKS